MQATHHGMRKRQIRFPTGILVLQQVTSLSVELPFGSSETHKDVLENPDNISKLDFLTEEEYLDIMDSLPKENR